MQKRRLLLVLILILVVTIAFPKDLNLVLLDKDIEIPLEGVTVKYINPEENKEETFFSDEKGKVSIVLDNETERVILECRLTGYETKKVIVDEFKEELVIKMVIEGMMEGEELVIEETYYEKEDKVGTSFVIDREEIKPLAMKGILEDVISSVKVMPGVSYSADFFTDISVRGGYSHETAASLDGFIVRYPFYWGQSSSIFNPNIVESVKFNNGIFNVKYGMAMSGLLEVNTKTPDNGFRYDINQATSTMEAYFQFPIGRRSGILFGGRATYLELTMGPIWVAQGVDVPRTPYIYDGNVKWFYKPNDDVEVYVNSFFGADGIAMGEEAKADEITIRDIFYNSNLHSIAVTGLKLMPTNRSFIHFFAGYEFLSNKSNGNYRENGEMTYSDEFIQNINDDQYIGFEDVNLNPGDTFEVNFNNEWDYKQVMNSVQTRLDTDIQFTDKIIFSSGGGLIYDNTSYKELDENWFMDNFNSEVNVDLGIDGLNEFNSSGYINFNFTPVYDKLEIDTGVRVDHNFSVNEGKLFNTYPALNPRFYIAYTPVRNRPGLEYFTMSFGTGLYSKLPDYIRMLANDADINSFDIKQEKCLTNVLGFEWMFPVGLKLKLEGYYKFYFDRFYTVEYLDSYNNVNYNIHSDGIGHAGGFDVILKRKISRYIDGSLSYSFVYAVYKNPQTDGFEYNSNGEPLGTWYFPYFHRFHGFNLNLNIKPADFFTISLLFGVHSGLIKPAQSSPVMYPYIDSNGTLLELYRNEESYSEQRTGVSLPLDIRLSYHNYFKNGKVRFETYIAMENILSLFYTPDKGEYLNKYTGEIEEKGSAAYEVFMPTFGLKFSY